MQHREEAMPNAITRGIDAYIEELHAAREAAARRQRRDVRAGIVAGSALAGMMTGDMITAALSGAVGLAAFEMGRSVEHKRQEPGHDPDRPYDLS